MLTLQSSFNLVLNDYVVAKVRARNSIGWGSYTTSSSVSGAQIKTVPVAPTTAVARDSSTSDT